ncbi:GlxA family transcriptional regulator [Mycobacterium kyorinense]|uniref:HTH araC/xylS-type domain-containing protein n=1 Tax=Mycobacterium kyorinense TaxID=487514 RepID=A0A1X1YDB9_9MYCO|nr:helix-turn-helix domain-containing protein [Mycobacterium kyorinense]ORW09031.1 hypothetical protein AWC14_22220 [Mycobacterium kyorinense]
MSLLVVVAPHTAIATSVAIARDLLWMACRERSAADRDRVVTATTDGGPVECGGAVTISADCALADLGDCALVWVAGFWQPPERAIEQNTALLAWLTRQHESGAIIAGHGPATMLLAAAGLLDHGAATTYARQADDFARRYPNVDLRPSRAITEAAGTYCAVGINSGCDLLVTVIARLYGGEIAARVAASALVDIQRTYRIATVAFDGQKYHRDHDVLEMQRLLETRYHQPLTVATLADRFHMSPRTLTRRFKAATGELPSQYLQRVRVEAAKDLLRNDNTTITDIASQVGYADVGAFSHVFAKHAGFRPGEFRQATSTTPLNR